MASEPVPAHANSVVFLLSQIGNEYANRFAHSLARTGLTPRGYGVLSLLDESNPPTQQDLADSLGIHRNGMVAVIDELEAAGWAQRRRDASDRRAFRIHLTAQGKRARGRAVEVVASLDAELREALSAQQLATLSTALPQVAQMLDLRTGLHPSMQHSPGRGRQACARDRRLVPVTRHVNPSAAGPPPPR